MTDEVVIEGDAPAADEGDTIVTVPVVVPAASTGSDELALTVGRIEGVLTSLVQRLDAVEATAETAAVVAETAVVVALDAAEEAAEEPPMVVEEPVEEDEEPSKEPWTHRKFGVRSE